MTGGFVAAASPKQWLDLIALTAPTRHKAAQRNALAVANCRAAFASQHADVGSASCMTMTDVARGAGLNNEQARRGTKTLREWGFLEAVAPPGENTPATYLLSLPEHETWREAWHSPPARAMPTEFPLTAGQEEVVRIVQDFMEGRGVPKKPDRVWPDHVLVIHGYAGTGKTTTVVRAVREIMGDLSDVLFLAPSNKAAAVLRGEGIEARTIHSAFYTVTGEDAETGDPIFMENPFNEGQAYSLIVIDEASMVSEETSRWIESQARRVLAIGDPMQLPPVKGLPYWTAPGREPDFVLTEVVRTTDQALEWAGLCLRQGAGLAELGSLVHDGGRIDPRDFDVVVTYTNQERATVNYLCRGNGPPAPGDRIMLLVNSRRSGDWALGGPDDYYNGQVLVIDRLIRSSSDADGVVPHHEVACTDENGMPRRILIQNRWLLNNPHRGSETEPPEQMKTYRLGGRDVLPATYAHAITAHKAQGSGWDSVLIISPGSQAQLGREEARRWNYTALTRAKRRVVIARLDQLIGCTDVLKVSGDI